MSQLWNDIAYDVQQLLYQPASRRSAVYVATVTGFTIVELLIVIVVIGILASIVIVAYNGIQARANTAAVKSDLSSFAKKVELYKATNSMYPPDATTLETLGIKVTKKSYDERNNMYYRVDTQGRWYTLGAITQKKEYCLLSGQLVEQASNVCNSYANAGNSVLTQATAAGVDNTTVNVGGSTGYDTASSTWASWAQ